MTTPSSFESVVLSAGHSLPQMGTSNKKYKPSRFNAHTTAPDGSLILFNTYSGHCCVVPSAGAVLAKRYLLQQGFEGSLDELGEYLLKAGYIMKEDSNELMMWDVAYAGYHYRDDKLVLTLLSSEDCNFRCLYCSQPFRRGTMLPSVRTAIRRFVQSRIEKLGYLMVGWFGGEPLLGYEAIEELAPYFQQASEANKVFYSSTITTNGYLLTPDRTSEMLQWGILAYQITVDGLPEDHDKKRPLRDGGPTLHRIIDNLVAMRQFAEPFQVRLRVNLDRENADRLGPFFEFVKDQLGGDPRFRIAFNLVGKWGGPNDEKLNVFTTEGFECQATLRDQAQQAGLPVESAITIAKSGQVLCQATLLGGFVVGADGRIMKCTNHGIVPEEINVVGQVLDDGTFKIDREKNLKWSLPYYNHDSKCNKCFYLPICRGGMMCPLARVRGAEPQCRQEKMHIRSLLLEYWRQRRSEGGARVLRFQVGTRSI